MVCTRWETLFNRIQIVRTGMSGLQYFFLGTIFGLIMPILMVAVQIGIKWVETYVPRS